MSESWNESSWRENLNQLLAAQATQIAALEAELATLRAAEIERTRDVVELAKIIEPAPALAPFVALVEAVQTWKQTGDEKVMHVLTCDDCKRLEKEQDKWCIVAGTIGRRQLESASNVRDALAHPAIQRAVKGEQA